ncbi:tudor domain-containing protein 3-like [Planoprotostelium fungivorum]|uniref:RecQ-mediated genome instability protein 1 n=1 Tax=Planoprotostelium fungivorum TaxID=1890364 RepID=A0A2P6NEH8_9EUKA|nr:tudor domain-containing protein 3-like [Planoprotostelium fungivorum]
MSQEWRQRLLTEGFKIKDDAWKEIVEEHDDYQKLRQDLLDTDLKEYASRVFPIGDRTKTAIFPDGPIVVQLTSLKNTSKSQVQSFEDGDNRIMFAVFTDGYTYWKAIEAIPGFHTFDMNTPPGTKFVIKTAKLRFGYIVLGDSETIIEKLGGRVPECIENWNIERNNLRQKRLGRNTEGLAERPPQFRPDQLLKNVQERQNEASLNQTKAKKPHEGKTEDKKDNRKGGKNMEGQKKSEDPRREKIHRDGKTQTERRGEGKRNKKVVVDGRLTCGIGGRGRGRGGEEKTLKMTAESAEFTPRGSASEIAAETNKSEGNRYQRPFRGREGDLMREEDLTRREEEEERGREKKRERRERRMRGQRWLCMFRGGRERSEYIVLPPLHAQRHGPSMIRKEGVCVTHLTCGPLAFSEAYTLPLSHSQKIPLKGTLTSDPTHGRSSIFSHNPPST